MNKFFKKSAIFFVLAAVFGCAMTAFAGDYEIKKIDKKDVKLFSIECRDVDIKDLLRAIAKENDLNLIIAEDISANVTLSFEEIPLTDALDAILKANKLSYIMEQKIIRIIKEEDTIKDEVEEVLEEPVEYTTEVVRLSYAQAAELESAISSSLPEGSTVASDTRTNSLILNVITEDIDGVKDVIRKLDTQTKQILIKAKIIEATEDFSRDMGVQWGGSSYTSAAYGTATGYNFPNSVGVAGSSGEGTYAVNLPTLNATSGLGINFGSLNSAVNLDMRLSAMEKNGTINIVSKPQITTLNNKPAKIHSGITFRVRTSSNTTTGDTTTLENELEEIQVGIDLVVTPKYTADNMIELAIDATNSEPDFSKVVDGIPGIIDKNANTTVLVKNGETTVIGGLYKKVNNEVTNSVPFFSKIPFLGWLFKNKSSKSSNEELLIFITPVLIEGDNVTQYNGK